MEQKNRILIVEDDTDINNLLYTALQKAGYETVQAFSGTEARMLFQMDKAGFSLILLDLMLPGISGEEVLAQIRKQGNTPVIVLTAKDGLDEKIGLLTSGADDYITNRLRYREVLARIQVQLRHMQQEPEHKSVSYKTWNWTVSALKSGLPECCFPKLQSRNLQFWSFYWSIRNRSSAKKRFLNMRGMNTIWERQRHWMYISAISGKDKAVTQEEYIDTVWGIGYRLHS